jgi:hypothetical protein
MVSLSKVLNIEPPARSTPNFVEMAITAAKPILHEKIKNLGELLGLVCVW